MASAKFAMLAAVAMLAIICQQQVSATTWNVQWREKFGSQSHLINANCGDVVAFANQGNHDIKLVPYNEASPCANVGKNAPGETLMRTTGAKVTFNWQANTTGDFQFICTVGSHCLEGKQYLMVKVTGSCDGGQQATASPPPPPPPSPSLPSPPPPPSKKGNKPPPKAASPSPPPKKAGKKPPPPPAKKLLM